MIWNWLLLYEQGKMSFSWSFCMSPEKKSLTRKFWVSPEKRKSLTRKFWVSPEKRKSLTRKFWVSPEKRKSLTRKFPRRPWKRKLSVNRFEEKPKNLIEKNLKTCYRCRTTSINNRMDVVVSKLIFITK